MPTPPRMTATVRAQDLPAELIARLGVHPLPGTRYKVTVEPLEETDEERLAALRADIAAAIAEVEAGNVIDADEVFRELEARWGKAQ